MDSKTKRDGLWLQCILTSLDLLLSSKKVGKLEGQMKQEMREMERENMDDTRRKKRQEGKVMFGKEGDR